MGVSAARTDSRSAGRPRPDSVVWHELEYGSYRADLPLWRELGREARERDPAGAVLEIGAGAGRVTLDLAQAGHEVTALEPHAEVLAELRRRAPASVTCVQGDARTLALARRDHALCIAPMQVTQLLGGARGRLAFLRGVRAHLRPGGLVALAIITAFEPFDALAGDEGPEPETTISDGRLYASTAVRVRVGARVAAIERDRRIVALADQRELVRERDVARLDRVGAERLEGEGARAGFSPQPRRHVLETDEYVGSEVVMLRA